MYSKLLKPSKTNNSFQYLPSKLDNPYELIKIHQYEMVLPVNTILAFRSAAVAVAAAVHVQRTLFEVSNPYAVSDPNGSLQNEVIPTSLPPVSSNVSSVSDPRKKSLLKSSFGSMTNAFDKMTHSENRDRCLESIFASDIYFDLMHVRLFRPSSPDQSTRSSASKTGGEFEDTIKFAKKVKKALNKVQWKDIICMLTQLEKLSEGNERKVEPTANDADGEVLTAFQRSERATRVRSSALLNPSVLISRYSGSKNGLLGTIHFGYPADIRPVGEALQKYSSYSFLENSSYSKNEFPDSANRSFQSHSLGSSMDALLTGTEVLPALWLMNYNDQSEVFNTPIGKQRKNESIVTPDRRNGDDSENRPNAKSAAPLLVGLNTYYSGPIANCNSLADDLSAPTSFLSLHSDPEGRH